MGVTTMILIVPIKHQLARDRIVQGISDVM